VSPEQTDQGSQRRYDHVVALDGLRFIAAAIVLVGHCFNVFAIPAPLERSIRSSPLVIFIYGYGAVHLFFVLSGFCLAGSADRARKLVDLTQFYIRRIMRIHPPYMYALALAWLASFFYETSQGSGALSSYIVKRAEVHLSLRELLPYFLYPSPAQHQLGPAWTLIIEMNFSFLLPLMLWITRRSHWSVLIGLSALALLQRHWPYSHLDYALFFALGIAIFQERERLASWAARLPNLAGYAIVLAGLAVFISPAWFRFMYNPGFEFSRSGWIASAAGGAILICCAIFLPPVNRLLSSRPLAYGGRISYSFYLLHFPIMILCARTLSAPVSWLDGLSYVVAVFILTFVAAAASFRFVERPSIRLGNRLCRALSQRTGSSAQFSRLGG
jgi:peptidoglycan/LPS O-acetylase OafA/YrhL